MFRVLRKVDSENIYDSELASWLDKQFCNDQEALSEITLMVARGAEMERRGRELKKRCPESLGESLFYICRHSNDFGYQNLIGQLSLQYTWPIFFEKFPLGQIWLTEISKKWFMAVWGGTKINYKGDEL